MTTGVATTYDLTTGVKLDFEDFIYILTPADVPLQGTYNGTSVPMGPNRSILGKEGATEKKVEWSEEILNTPRTTLNGAVVTADTYITLATGERERFGTSDVIRIDDELMRITSYGTTAETLVVTKGYAGTTSAQHTNAAAEIIGVGTAANEGADPEAARVRDRSGLYNLTEIFGPYAITVSGTEETVQKYGVTSEFNKQTANRLKELFVAIEQATLYGTRYEDAGNKRRLMGGFTYFIATNVDSTTTQISETKLIDQLQKSYNNGGSIDTLITGAQQKRNISAFSNGLTGSANVLKIDRADRVRGQVVSVYESDFGEADVVLDRFVRISDLFGIDRQYVSYAQLRAARGEVLAKTGDSLKAQVLCETSLKVRMEKRHARFSALT